MAILIPAFSSCSARMTTGERRFAQRLEDKLEDDYLLWYDVAIAHQRLHPDFIVLHPERGIIVLEVKDWKLSSLLEVNPDRVKLLTANGIKVEKNPLEQARGYALAIVSELQQDQLLVQVAGKFQGKLAFPYSYGVVFTNITRKQFESVEGLGAVLEPNLIICQDEMYESVDAHEFQQRLWNLCIHQFGAPLTPTQIDRIRWHIFPEIRIGTQEQSLLGTEIHEEDVATLPDILRVMDLQQEQLARSLGEGHRIIHGVAGSGKTLILGYRGQHLAQQMTKPVLVLCFNVALAAKLRQLFHRQGLAQVEVMHFHGWCSEILQAHHIAKPNFNQFSGAAYVEELVQRVIRSVNQGLIPAGQYGAVMVDEGHDFQPAWLKLIAQMVDPATNSLLILYDDAQSIYPKRQHQPFSFKSLGIQAQGRTTILKINYRNTEEVLGLACRFAKDLLMPKGDQQDDAPVVLQPQTSGRQGPKPQLIHLPSFRHEIKYLCDRAAGLHQVGTAWNEMAIIYRYHWQGQQICQQVQASGLPIEWINRDTNSRRYRPLHPSIKLVTMHSSKGLEFPVVFIPGVGAMPSSRNEQEEEARLLYVAMTRSIDRLVLTCDRKSEFVQRLTSALGHD